MTTCDFVAIGWIIPLFGFYITNRQNNQRVTRNEIRAKLDQLNKELINLLDASKSYYLDKNAQLDIQIISIHNAINICDRLIVDLSKTNPPVDLERDFDYIFELVTGGNFESKNHQPSNDYTDLCKNISLQKESLLKVAEEWFRKTFH